MDTTTNYEERRTVIEIGMRVSLSPDRLQGRATDPAGWIVDSIDGQFARLRHVGGGDWREPARLSDLIVDSIDCPRCHGDGFYPISLGGGVTHGVQKCTADCLDRAIAADEAAIAADSAETTERVR